MERLNQADTNTMMKTWTQFLAEALRNPRIAELICAIWSDFRQYLGGMIRQAQEEGKINPEVDCYVVARLYISLHDGLSIKKILDLEMNILKTAEAFRAISSGNFWQNNK